MYEFLVKSLPLKHVIRDIAEELNTDYSSISNFYRVDIPAAFGSGFIEGVDFESGFGMIKYHCTFNKRTTINFTFNLIHPLKFLYCYKNNFKHKFPEMEAIHSVQQYESLIVGSKDQYGHVLIFEKDEAIRITSLEIDRKRFSIKLREILDSEESTNELIKAVKDTRAKTHFYYKGKYSVEIADIIDEVPLEERSPLLNYLVHYGKSYEVLWKQIENYYEDVSEKTIRHILKKKDVEVVKRVCEYIADHINLPLTVNKLESTFGLSSRKLQELFNELHNESVNGYIQNQRLKAAMNYIVNSDMNVSEVADAIGISSKSYFSKIFKDKYGISPSYYIKKSREK